MNGFCYIKARLPLICIRLFSAGPFSYIRTELIHAVKPQTGQAIATNYKLRVNIRQREPLLGPVSPYRDKLFQ